MPTKGYTNVNYAVADIPHNEGKTSSSVGVMDRIMAFKDDSAPDQAARNEAIGKFLTFFYDPENYVGWVSMEDFLPARELRCGGAGWRRTRPSRRG